MRQPPTRIPSREIAIWSSWSIKLLATCNIENTAPYGEVYWCALCAVVWKEGAGSEGLKNDGWLGWWDDQGWFWAELEVGDYHEEGKEEDVDGGKEGLAGCC